jgi:hypothetical protein
MTDAPNTAPTTPVPDAAARLAAKAERSAEAKSAWNEYLGEREALAARTEKLRALRLAAEEQAAKAEAKAAKAEARKPKAASKPVAKKATAKPAAKAATKPAAAKTKKKA